MTRPTVAEDGYPPLPAGSGAAAAVEAVLVEAAESFAVDCDFDTYEPHKCNVLIAAHDVGARLLDFESYHSLAALSSVAALADTGAAAEAERLAQQRLATAEMGRANRYAAAVEAVKALCDKADAARSVVWGDAYVDTFDLRAALASVGGSAAPGTATPGIDRDKVVGWFETTVTNQSIYFKDADELTDSLIAALGTGTAPTEDIGCVCDPAGLCLGVPPNIADDGEGVAVCKPCLRLDPGRNCLAFDGLATGRPSVGAGRVTPPDDEETRR